jgi:hypothetical protein
MNIINELKQVGWAIRRVESGCFVVMTFRYTGNFKMDSNHFCTIAGFKLSLYPDRVQKTQETCGKVVNFNTSEAFGNCTQ